MGADAPTLSAARARQILDGAHSRRVLVLGDMVLDDHMVGSAGTMAREAPVPVIEMESHYAMPGGATNVAVNLHALGCTVSAAGVVGNDAAAQTLRSQLDEKGIEAAGLVADASRQTSVKLRVWAGEGRKRQPHMMARVDTVDRQDLDGATAESLVAYLEQALPNADVLLISDYENGVVGSAVLGAALRLARQHEVRVAVDAHGQLARFQGVMVATPNQPEAEAELGRGLESAADIRAGASELRERLRANGVLITLGAAGMVVAGNGDEPVMIAAAPQNHVADATGAGDTVAAAVTAGLLGGATFVEAALLAELSARIVVRRLGVAVPSIEEILAEADAAR